MYIINKLTIKICFQTKMF